MSRYLGHVFFAAACVLAATAAHSDAQTRPRRASFAPVGAVTSTPLGWVDFCHRYLNECAPDRSAADPLKLSATLWTDLAEVNQSVNAAIVPVSDLNHWGVIDQWDYPTDGRGDCEDYALLKRKILNSRGYPVHALLLTVVRDPTGEGHAVLTVATDHGDFILDNQNDLILIWDQTGYRYVKRQSPGDPNIWLAIGEAAPSSMTTAR